MATIRFESSNQLVNGDFEAGSLTGWLLYISGGAAGSQAISSAAPYEGIYNDDITITAGGSTVESVMPYNSSSLLSVVSGMTYKVTFAAKAAAARNIGIRVRESGTPWNIYGFGSIQDIGVTTSWQVFTKGFTSAGSSQNAYLNFLLGLDTNDVELDAIEFFSVVNFTKNPKFGDLGAPLKFRQPRDTSDGGVLYVYDKGITEQKFVLKWESLSLVDWTSLKSFIDTVAVGAKNSFTYYDEDGVAWTVRLISDTRDFRQVRSGRYTGSLTLLKVA